MHPVADVAMPDGLLVLAAAAFWLLLAFLFVFF
jgi:hypothetical protein